MSISGQLDQLHARAKTNRWMHYFTLFTRVALAIGFFPSGMQKVLGYRFTSLAINHPMGNYLEALHLTGYYYPFIGVMQVLAAILLLIPRTALLGALIYFPIILNICILSLSVRFDGSLLTSPLMVLATLYLLAWDYDRLKAIIFRPVKPTPIKQLSNKFPFRFFAGVFITMILVALTVLNIFELMPRNHMRDCMSQCADAKDPAACAAFCECIHAEGKPLNSCLTEYYEVVE